MAYSSFFVARGLAAVFLGAGFSVGASASDALARVVVFFAAGFAAAVAGLASPLASAFASALASALAAGLASDFGGACADFLASVFFAGAFDCSDGFAASSASLAACAAAASSSRARSLLHSVSVLCAELAALLPWSVMSESRRIVKSCRWPLLTRRRAFGRYLNAMTFSPRP